ncbi:PhaM family polyhydroxyalkanoate granule multifunctional regulatory protein [Zoogloea sp. LCSB751]|uniref:PhaM family polyhydroxyalkanoate granule multifunctional regulatory protein n=1 Tax=Zoogloea sp. LCSB751 TaxID=1965277 RepID=UPI0009A52508|nr:PhaM family polyhydroxyalkanoate granule multifunctional regulatory protein [Zoogloea sp. LCSB751]
MSTDNKAQDPMEFMRNMWSKMGFNLPGMVTPTLDVDELDKRIADMKAVENWLKMNLSSLQMATQGLEMQRATIATMQAMSKLAAEGGKAPEGEAPQPNPFASSMWPWNLMQNAAEQAKSHAEAAPAQASPAKAKPKDSK